MSSSASAIAKKKASQPDSAELAALAAARDRTKARRRQRAKQRDHGDEYMDMNVDVDPQWNEPTSTAASDRGAGRLGFAGTSHREAAAEATGLTTLAGDQFGGGPQMPMLPGTWDVESALEGSEGPRDTERPDN
jgi:PPE-repeat protein